MARCGKRALPAHCFATKDRKELKEIFPVICVWLMSLRSVLLWQKYPVFGAGWIDRMIDALIRMLMGSGK
jgi:hypothetical protein